MKKTYKKLFDYFQKIVTFTSGFFDRVANKIIDFFNKNHFLLMILFISIGALIVRIAVIPIVSGDTYWFLEPWVRYIRDNGGLASLDQIPISHYQTAIKDYPYGVEFTSPVISIVYGNYPVFYYFLLAIFSYLPISELAVVKLISYIFDFALAFGLLKTLSVFTNNKVSLVIIYLLGLILPTFIINSAIWGQIDVIYGSMAVWMLYFIIKNRPKTAMLFVGLALSIKLQIVFILPIVGWLFLKRKYSLRYLLIPLFVVFLTYLPSYIAGMSFMTPINHHLALSSTYYSITLNAGSLYAFLYGINTKLSPFISPFALGLTLLVCVVVIYYFYKENIRVNARSIVLLGAIFSILVPYLLPHMHERYFYMAEVLLLLYAFTIKGRWHLVILSQLSGLITYANFALGGWYFPSIGNGNLVIASTINIVIIALLLVDTKHLDRDKSDKGLETSEKYYS